MKIINVLFYLFLLILNGCNADDSNTQQAKSRKKRDLTPKEEQQETPKSPEELLKEKLTEDQKKHLDWLKTALTKAGEFDKFLQHDESKIKSALDHIKSELDKCNGKDSADEQENTFKTVVQGALEGNINDFKTNTNSTCDSQ